MLSREIAQLLLKLGAVKVRPEPPFQWVSGIKSPVYCDNRMLISYPEARRKIIDGFKRVISENGVSFDVVGGTATAAIPWAAFLAYDLDFPMIYIRPEPKDHGTGKQIEGFLERDKHVLIVEDLISTGGSSVKAAQTVRNEGGCTVTDVFAIVNWELPDSYQKFGQANLRLHYLTGFDSLISEAVSIGYLDNSQYEMVKKFREDPWKWPG